MGNRLAVVVFPLVVDARRRAVWSRRAGQTARPRCSRSAGQAHAEGSEVDGARGELRRSVAQLAKPAIIAPAKRDFPLFDEQLRAAMKTETEMFFANIIREDRSVLEFVDADYT